MTRLDVDLALMRADVIVDALRPRRWVPVDAIAALLAWESDMQLDPAVIYGDLNDLEAAGRVQARRSPGGLVEWRALEPRPDIAEIAAALGGLDDGR